MTILKNARRERYAQALASGKTASQAYAEAGYRQDRRNASRVAELQSRAADAAVLAKQWVIERLVEIAERAMHHRGVIRRGWGRFPDFDSAGANRALELLGWEIDMFVDLAEQDTNIRVISARPVSAEDWERKYTSAKLLHLVPNETKAE